MSPESLHQSKDGASKPKFLLLYHIRSEGSLKLFLPEPKRKKFQDLKGILYLKIIHLVQAIRELYTKFPQCLYHQFHGLHNILMNQTFEMLDFIWTISVFGNYFQLFYECGFTSSPGS